MHPAPIALSALGFGMVISFMALIMTRRLSSVIALIVVPTAFALAAGVGGGLSQMMLDGIVKVAPTAVMLMFAVLYFGVMLDAGLFDPIVTRILRMVQDDPLKVVVGTALLASFVSLDGDGSTTYMVTVSAMLPLYRRLNMNPLHLSCVTILASGVMNLTPWGGPTARAASALGVDAGELFVPMVPVLVIGVVVVIVVARVLGARERTRLGRSTAQGQVPRETAGPTPSAAGGRSDARPRLLVLNAALTTALLIALIAGALPLPALFMLGFAIAIGINYPALEDQRRCLARHASNVTAVISLIFAAGVFSGILSGAGMAEAMSRTLLEALPPALGPHLAVVTAILSAPCTFFVSNDAFYFGMLPIIAKSAQSYGISELEIARASLIGQPVHLLSPLVPSTYLLVSLAGVDFADHQRFTLQWAFLLSLALLLASLALSLFPLVSIPG